VSGANTSMQKHSADKKILLENSALNAHTVIDAKRREEKEAECLSVVQVVIIIIFLLFSEGKQYEMPGRVRTRLY